MSSSSLAPHPMLKRYYRTAETKRSFLTDIFNDAACDYDRVEKMLGFGSGSWYRRQALVRSGLARGMRVLDVAAGTGLMAREALSIVGDARLILGLDPSIGMLQRAVSSLKIPAVLGVGEQLPLRDESVDFLSMGYALRHLGSLTSAFAEFWRVLKPGGRLCIVEITRPQGVMARFAVRAYMRWIVPGVTRVTGSSAESKRLWQYYWDTIEACVPPSDVIEALTRAGFVDVKHHTALSLFSEYTGRRA